MNAFPVYEVVLTSFNSALRDYMKAHGIRRSMLPAVLGFNNTTNPSKLLRRFDEVCKGLNADMDIVERFRNSELGTPEILRLLNDLFECVRLRNEQNRFLDECVDVIEFVPHLHAVHEHTRPSHPFFHIAWYGIDTFKLAALPDVILDLPEGEARLTAVADFCKLVCTHPDYTLLRGNSFGSLMQLLYRDTYTHAYVYSVADKKFVGEYHGVPPSYVATLRF